MSKKKQAAAYAVHDVLTTIINDREVAPRKKERKISTKPTTFHIQLTEEQKLAKATILENVVTFLKGKPGTAKSTLACNAALDRLIKGHVDKIILTRPTEVVGKDLGFLPGAANDAKGGKLGPYIAPLLDTMYDLRAQKEIDDMLENGKIEVLPIQFVRGKNFRNVAVVIDESQNMTVEDMKAITTRVCDNTWLIFTSDVNQIDKQNKSQSAAHFVDRLSKLDGVAVIELFENFRHPLALEIMDLLDVQVAEKRKEKEESNEVLKATIAA